MKTNLFSKDRIISHAKNAIKKSSFSLVVVLFVFIMQQSFAQDSMVGDGFGGNPGYTPTNYGVGAYNGYANCNGTLKGWGDNNHYQLGNGSTAGTFTPIDILTNVKFFSAGYAVAVIKNDNSLWAWGGSGGNTIDQSMGIVPSQIDTNVKYVSAGFSHIAYCKNDGTAWVAGSDGAYCTYCNNITPHQVIGISNCVRTTTLGYTAGGATVFLLSDGTVKYVWKYITQTNTPQLLSVTNVVDIKSTQEQLFMLKSDGTVWMYGGIYPPAKLGIPAGISIKAISADNDGEHVLALSTTGDVYAWTSEYWAGAVLPGGGTIDGIYGDDGTVLVATNVKDIMAGETFSYIVKNDGTLWAVGFSKNYDNSTGGIWMNLSNLVRAPYTQINPLITPMNLCAIVSACNAGTTAPTLSGTAINNSCPTTTVNLNTLVTSSSPSGASLVWFTNNAHTGTAYATPTAAGAGTYYAFYYDSVNVCYSPATAAVNVTITLPPSVPTVASTTQPTCGVPTGTIVFTTQSGVLYSIDNGLTYQASPTFSGLAAGTYTLKVRSTTNTACSTQAASTVTIAFSRTGANDDFDCDGVINSIDIDDDNDGVLDTDETPSCYYTQAEAGVIGSVTSSFSGWYGTDRTLWYDNNLFTSSDWPPLLPVAGLEFFNITPVKSPLSISAIKFYSGALLNYLPASVKLQGYNGATWVDLGLPERGDATLEGQTIFYNTLHPNTPYQKFRIFGVSGTTSYGACGEIVLVTSSPSYGASAPKVNCTVDTDGDGIINSFDLDSDGDGCPDSFESGVSGTLLSGSVVNQVAGSITSTIMPKAIAAGPYGANGLADGVETSSESGITNYVNTYSTIANNKFQNLCTDTDGDGIGDVVDIDDDNDGVLDVEEAPSCYYTQTEVSGISLVTTEIPPHSKYGGNIADCYDNNYNTNSLFNVSNIFGRDIFNITPSVSPLAISAITFDMGIEMLTSGSTAVLQGYNGINWIDLAAPQTATVSYGTQIFANTLHPNTKYLKFRIFGVSGTNDQADCIEIHLKVSPVSYGSSAPKDTCYVDTDSDGIPNIRDLDSDGDGCSDAKESGATTSNVTNYTFPGPYGTNGLANVVEAGTDSGVVNYTLNYSNATNSAIRACVITCPIVTNSSSDNINSTTCGGANGSIKLCGLAANVTGYTINYTRNGIAATSLTNQTADANGCLLISNLGAAIYSNIIITHALYCTTGTTALGPITLTSIGTPSVPTVASTTQPTCSVTTGTIVFTIQAGVEYSIDNGANYQSNPTFTGLVPGTYNLRVRSTTDASCSTPAANIVTINAVSITTTPTLTVSGAVCNGSTYQVSFNSNGTVTASAGTVSGNTITGIAVGTNVVLTSSVVNGCASTQTTVQSPVSCVTPPTGCITPTISTGNGVCSGTGTYSVSVSASAGAVISASSGTVSGNSVTGIAIGTSVSITATSGTCTSSVTVSSPTNCTTPCVTAAVSYSVGRCLGTTYSVSISNPNGASISASAGSVTATSIIGIPTGTNVTITTTVSGCSSEMITLSSPAGCVIDAVTETTTPINGGSGGTSSSLTTNDTLNGMPVVIGNNSGNVVLSPISFPTGLTLNTTTGQVSVAPNTPAGTYPVVYTICEAANTSNCDTVTSYVVVFVTDFTPTIDIDNVVFLSAGVSRDFVVNISEIESGPSVGQVVFKIFKQSAFKITYDTSATTANVGGGTVVNNSDWIITENASFITITLKPNVIINASTFSSVGFTISRNSNIPSQTWQPITATIVNGSGADSLDENNVYNILVKAQ